MKLLIFVTGRGTAYEYQVTATIFSSLIDDQMQVHIVIDKDVLKEDYYGCSDGTTTGYMKIKTEDIIVMCSDGILESNTEYENKEIWLKNLLENIESQEPEKIANIIMQEAIDNGLGIAKDDMTILVAKVEKIEK